MELNYEEMKKICLDFFMLCGMEFSLWDENRKNIFSYPKTHSSFCRAVREDNNLFRKCRKCDDYGLEQVMKTKMPYIYTCHMGLTEAIIPILQEQEIAGYLMLGQIAEEENMEKILSCIASSVSDTAQKLYLADKLRDTTSCSHEKITYCMNTLQILIDYMNLSYVIQKPGENTFYLAKKYIVNHMSEPILPKNICQSIGASSNALYKTVLKHTGMSTTEFIRKIKMDEACRLLETTSESISDIAESIGISDVNYFIRVFRKQVGTSPLKYRKKAEFFH